MFLDIGPVNDIDSKLREFQGDQALLMKSCPPVIAVTDGPKYFVILEGIFYPTNTILDSINLLQKAFFVFNLSYPKQSVDFYTFIQEFFYEIKSETLTSEAVTLLNELKKN